MSGIFDHVRGNNAADLLSNPDAKIISGIENGDTPSQIERVTCTYSNNSARFITKSIEKGTAYKTQFAQIYFQRLVQMRPSLKLAAEKKWGGVQIEKKLLDMRAGKKCVIIGTIYKEMKLKPNILDEHHAREKYEAPPPSRSKYFSSDDSIVLEDQSGRVGLSGDVLLPKNMVTGVVIAVMGRELASGEFGVEDYCFALPGPQAPLQGALTSSSSDRFVVLISGLCIGASSAKSLLGLQLFVDYATGQLGSTAEQETASRICRVVIAGNSIDEVEHDTEQAVYKSNAVEAKSVSHVRELDDILAQLTACVPVDIMPGFNDPSNCTMPQQPMHRCMFPKGASTGLLRGVTNPYDFTLDATQFVGTSGQGVDDIYKFCELEDRLEILCNTIDWAHLCPTAPDTLTCFPFYQNDPFVMTESAPHVVFAGNQPAFATRVVEGAGGTHTRAIAVPNFHKTMEVVVVNIRTTQCYAMSFDAGSDMDCSME
eukprot:m.789764 g.789764  ORF g.789764 m.789764 type:complete len:484 (-) comp23324_c1_seq2:70-1521(-)